MTWDELVQAMKDDGFAFEIVRERYDPNDLISNTKSRAWRVQGIVSGTVYSDADDPRTALAELLAKCRETWPAKHPWDGLALEDLLAVCVERGWTPDVHLNSFDRIWHAKTDLSDFTTCNSRSPAEALRTAMKRREEREMRP